MQLRDYQVEAIANVYISLGIEPAGTDDDPVVRRYREIIVDGGSDGDRQNGHDGWLGGNLAAGSSDDDLAPL